MQLPPISEQHEIVRRVEALFAHADALEAKYRAAREQADRLTPAVLAKAFRGELVPQDPNDEPAAEMLERIRAARAAQPAAPRARRTRTPRKVTAPISAQPESTRPEPADMAPAETPPASKTAASTSPSAPVTQAGTRTLADLRKAAGLNQAAVAKAMGLNQAYISQMETGKRPITEAQRAKLAEILGVTVKELP